MKIFGLNINLFNFWERKADGLVDINSIVRRLDMLYQSVSGITVTPENCMQSPTVQAIVTYISRRVSTLPIKVFRQSLVDGRVRKELLPDHPVVNLLNKPNDWLTRSSYWLDSVSQLLRYGNVYAVKLRGVTGPVRSLIPVHPSAVHVEQDSKTMQVKYRIHTVNNEIREYDIADIHHVRGPARNGLVGDSPVMDIREAIALEIAAEQMGSAFLGNGAMPSIIFKYAVGSQGHRTDEERKKFIDDYTSAYSNKGRFKAMLMPKGIEMADPIQVEAEKAQFLQTRQYQRTVITGAFGFPPHLAGDLTKMTFGNVEQQSLDLVAGVISPYCSFFEAAMERDLLTEQDRRSGVMIRFDLDNALRGDFKSQQEGLQIQRQNGIISANDWREKINMNPISEEDGGDEYWRKGPSGQDANPPNSDETDQDAETDPPEDNEEQSLNAKYNANGNSLRKHLL